MDPSRIYLCSQCHAPIPPTAELDALFEDLFDPSTRAGTAPLPAPVLLCTACSVPAPDPSTPAHATQTPSSSHTYRVQVTFTQLTPGQSGEQAEDWEPVGGFTLRGTGATVRDFTDAHAEEWANRLAQILQFAEG